MSEHDPLCPCAKWRADLALCACRTIRTIRADERERIAQAIEAQHRRWLEDPSYRSGLFVQATARIARNGGRDE